MTGQRVCKVPVSRHTVQKHPGRINGDTVHVLCAGRHERLHGPAARQRLEVGRHHHGASHVVWALEHLEYVVRLEHGVRVDTHVRVELLFAAHFETLAAGRFL